jgi:hypothetical protein
VFKSASQLVREHGGQFFVTTLLGQMSDSLKRRLESARIPVVNASADGIEYTNRPDDHHPNALANRIYAAKIHDYLVNLGTANDLVSKTTNTDRPFSPSQVPTQQTGPGRRSTGLVLDSGMVTAPAGQSTRTVTVTKPQGREPVTLILEADPVLRTRLKPKATWEMTVSGRPVVMDVDEFGCRPVVGQPLTAGKTLAVYGCSCTYGQGIAAEETFCSLLQGMLPTWRVENHGVPGYGTTQNLLQLQRNSRWSPADYVTFCWIPDHLTRNGADISWIQRLMRGRNRGPQSRFPKAHFDTNGLLVVTHVEIPRPELIGIDATEFRQDAHYNDRICFGLFKSASQIVQERGGHFFVTTLLGQLSDSVKRWLDHAQIPLLDASLQGVQYTNLPDDHHPNALANRIYADAIEKYVRSNS